MATEDGDALATQVAEAPEATAAAAAAHSTPPEPASSAAEEPPLPYQSTHPDLPSCDEHWAVGGAPRLPAKRGAGTPVSQEDVHRWELDRYRCRLFAAERPTLQPLPDWAALLEAIHLIVHPIFSDRFLPQFSQLPAHAAVHNQEFAATIEFEIDAATGKLLRISIGETSGVPLFDAAAMRAFREALPVVVPTALAEHGTIALRWQVHRLPAYACSAYFARVLDPGHRAP